MGTTETTGGLGDPDKQHKVVPLVVSSILTPDPSGGEEHPPQAMLVSIDAESIPGFGEILDRQEAGEEFDVVSRWGALTDQDGKHSPLVLLEFYLPDFDLGVSIPVEVDEYPKSILAAIKTKKIVIVDPAPYVRLQEEGEVLGLLDEMRVFTISPPDATPAIGVMQQRFDLPRPKYEAEKHDLDEGNRKAAIDLFLKDARPVAGVGYMIRGNGPVLIALVDPESGEIAERIPRGAKVEGRWGAMSGGGKAVLAFDAVYDGELIGHWILPPDPDKGLIQAGSNGAHEVAIFTELTKGDPEKFEEQMASAIRVWVEHCEVFRKLRLGDGFGDPGRDGGAEGGDSAVTQTEPPPASGDPA